MIILKEFVVVVALFEVPFQQIPGGCPHKKASPVILMRAFIIYQT